MEKVNKKDETKIEEITKDEEIEKEEIQDDFTGIGEIEIQDEFNDDETIFESAENVEEVDSDDNENEETE